MNIKRTALRALAHLFAPPRVTEAMLALPEQDSPELHRVSDAMGLTEAQRGWLRRHYAARTTSTDLILSPRDWSLAACFFEGMPTLVIFPDGRKLMWAGDTLIAQGDGGQFPQPPLREFIAEELRRKALKNGND
jgi:hypothetical protein